MGSLQHSPRLPSWILRGPTSKKRTEKKEDRGREGKGKKEKKGRDEKGKAGFLQVFL